MEKLFSIFSLAIVLLLISLNFNSPAFGERFDIRDDDTGGDCTEIGIWDKTSKTCNMNRDLPIGDQIRISSDGVTLNGMGHRITGDGTISGIYIPDRQNVTVTNLVIYNAEDGVFLNNSSNNTIENITSVWNTEHAIYMIHNSDNNTIKNNSLGFSIEHGISIAESNYNNFENNIITKTKDAIRLKFSNYTTISGNYILDNRVEGIDLHESENNFIYNNNIFEKEAISIINNCEECPNEYFGNDGGNYYLVYDENEEGCFDLDSNGFCDMPYSFKGGADEFPLIQNSAEKLNQSKKLELLLKFEDLGPSSKSGQPDKISRDIPEWIKNNAGWWSDGSIGDSDFVSGIQFLIQENLIDVEVTSNTSEENQPNEIPTWIKNSAGWWSQGLISDGEFLTGMDYLVENGIIQV